MIDVRATALTKARYNRIAPLYERLESVSERRFKSWREKLWALASGRTLEVGVGTGKNIPLYPRGVQVTAIDLL